MLDAGTLKVCPCGPAIAWGKLYSFGLGPGTLKVCPCGPAIAPLSAIIFGPAIARGKLYSFGLRGYSAFSFLFKAPAASTLMLGYRACIGLDHEILCAWGKRCSAVGRLLHCFLARTTRYYDIMYQTCTTGVGA